MGTQGIWLAEQPREILATAIKNRTEAIISHLSRGKWHMTKVMLSSLGANVFNVEILPRRKRCPLNININDSVGISFKYGYSKFIFETKVLGFELSENKNSPGRIVISIPNKIEVLAKRSYFRVNIPSSLDVPVTLSHYQESKTQNSDSAWTGKLIDISAGGAQVAVPATQNPTLKKGHTAQIKFTSPNQNVPITIQGLVRYNAPTADEKNICIGFQIIGLEATEQGRATLAKLVEAVEYFYNVCSNRHANTLP